jgi:hypothetical protein
MTACIAQIQFPLNFLLSKIFICFCRFPILVYELRHIFKGSFICPYVMSFPGCWWWGINIELESKGFWWWCILPTITGGLDFVRREYSKKIEDTKFRKLILFPSSGEVGDTIPSYLSKIYFNIVHPPSSWSCLWSLSFWLSYQYPMCNHKKNSEENTERYVVKIL